MVSLQYFYQFGLNCVSEANIFVLKNLYQCTFQILQVFHTSKMHHFSSHTTISHNNNNNVLVVNSGSWIPNVQSKSQYLQVDLLQVRNISAIMTQGRNKWECNCGEWVTLYTLSYSLCGSIWSEYIANGSIKVRLVHSVTYHYVRAIIIILIISISFVIIIIESYPLSLYFCPSPWPLSSSSLS